MQYIGIILAIGVWIYFEFYRIPRTVSLAIDSLGLDKINNDLNTCKLALGNCQDAFDEVWEKLDEFDQKFDVGTKQAPKAVSRN